MNIWHLTWIGLKTSGTSCSHRSYSHFDGPVFVFLSYFEIRVVSYTNLSECSFKRQPYKQDKHTQKIIRLLPKNCLSLFHDVVGLALKGLSSKLLKTLKINSFPTNFLFIYPKKNIKTSELQNYRDGIFLSRLIKCHSSKRLSPNISSNIKRI